jgi:hypothetical protein
MAAPRPTSATKSLGWQAKMRVRKRGRVAGDTSRQSETVLWPEKKDVDPMVSFRQIHIASNFSSANKREILWTKSPWGIRVLGKIDG